MTATKTAASGTCSAAGLLVRWFSMRARVGDRLVAGEDLIGEAVGVPSPAGEPVTGG